LLVVVREVVEKLITSKDSRALTMEKVEVLEALYSYHHKA
jgi:hypothetical protein